MRPIAVNRHPSFPHSQTGDIKHMQLSVVSLENLKTGNSGKTYTSTRTHGSDRVIKAVLTSIQEPVSSI